MTDAAATDILLVEDNPGDVILFSEAVEAAKMTANVHVVGDGLAAMRYLRREGDYVGMPRPDVVVLDLDLPLKSGHEVLAELRAEPAMTGTPVAVFTTSGSEAAICKGYTDGLCRFFTKTGDFGKLRHIVKQIEEFAIAVRYSRPKNP
ncbi:MAG: response regulator [Acidobacteriia bacterium]|nr:response regulator [Terriglobia bacterium]